MDMKRLVLMFDLDGTLLDTNGLILASFRHTFAKYMPEKELAEEELLTFLGPPLRDSFARYFEKQQLDEIIDYYRIFNHDKHEKYVTVYPTVPETLKYYKDQGCPMAVVTTKPNFAAQMGLDMFGLTPYFDLLIGLDKVTETKPDPEGILKCMQHFGTTDGIMIGDSPADIMAGKNAGVYTAGVEWTFKPVELLTALSPDVMLREMKDLIPFVEKLGYSTLSKVNRI